MTSMMTTDANQVACHVVEKELSIPFAKNQADGIGTMMDLEHAQTAMAAVFGKIRRGFNTHKARITEPKGKR
jgi:hypothetical protein